MIKPKYFALRVKNSGKSLDMSYKDCNFAVVLKVSGFSAVGSAHVWGARGRWFESSNPDQNKKLSGSFT